MQTSYGTNERVFTALILVRYENLDIFEEYLETLNFDDNQLKFIRQMRHDLDGVSNDVSITTEKLKPLISINNNYRYELYLNSCEITGDNSEIEFELPYAEKMANYDFNHTQLNKLIEDMSHSIDCITNDVSATINIKNKYQYQYQQQLSL